MPCEEEPAANRLAIVDDGLVHGSGDSFPAASMTGSLLGDPQDTGSRPSGRCDSRGHVSKQCKPRTSSSGRSLRLRYLVPKWCFGSARGDHGCESGGDRCAFRVAETLKGRYPSLIHDWSLWAYEPAGTRRGRGSMLAKKAERLLASLENAGLRRFNEYEPYNRHQH